MDTFAHLDLLSVGVAVAGTCLLGFVILFNNVHSATNRAFFYFTIVTVVWSVFNFSYYQLPADDAALWLLRGVMFCAVWHAFTFFHLAFVFPEVEHRQPLWYTYVLLPTTAAVSILTLTPYVFAHINVIDSSGSIGGVQTGPAIALFGILVLLLILLGIWKLVSKTVSAPLEHRRPYSLMLIGMILTFGLLLTFNFFIPTLFNNPQFIPFSALYLLPFVMMTSYAINRHHLFDLKVVTTAFVGFMVTVFTFINVLYSTQPTEIIVNITAFITVLLGSIKIVQDTLHLEILTAELKQTSERQEGLFHFIGHEVKGFLAKDANAFAALRDGDFGALPEQLKSFVEQALKQSRDGERSVTDILKASNLKKGMVSYAKEPFNLKARVAEAVESMRPIAEQKGLALSFTADDSCGSYMLLGDKNEITDHVLRNLIDNAINYTPSGSIALSLVKENGKMILKVKDTGVGIADDDRKYLWTEGGHGKDSQKINVHSTGYGLYIAKKIIEDHGGTIEAESEGAGMGATFIVEFPG